MWSSNLFNILAKLSHDRTTFATFTAAGIAKRNLQSAGFSIKKVPGFANKREMLIGCWTDDINNESKDSLNNKNHQDSASNKQRKIKDATPWHVVTDYQPAKQNDRIAIIGAGLAGCHTAYALAKRGFKVSLIDKNQSIAQEASGNPQGVLYIKLSADNGILGQFNLASLLYAQSFYQPFWQNNKSFGEQCGVLQLGFNQRNQQIHQTINESFIDSECIQLINANQASNIANLAIEQSALFFPYCGWLQPYQLCRWLIDSDKIELISDLHINEIISQTKESNLWLLKGKRQDTSWESLFDHVIIANAKEASTFSQTNHLPVKSIRGQISYIESQSPLDELKAVVCSHGYIAPATTIDNHYIHAIGATFNLNDHSKALSEKDHQDNIDNVITQHLNHSIKPIVLGGRVGFRCTSPDYLPLTGPIPDVEAFSTDYAELMHNARLSLDTTGTYFHGLHCNIAHGSRGLAYAPLSAEILASTIAGEPPPVSQRLVDALNPGRFIIRDMMRKNKNKNNQ
jgi:tRNA 5-methylaminomethyl-2-thiouridine biosynthesis bifunctional protein